MVYPNTDYEIEIWSKGGLACGIDEVGRGCVAGPVVAASVIMPKGHKPIDDIRDSKKLSQKKREALFEEILSSCADFGIGLIPAQDIDNHGIVPATKNAMLESFNQLSLAPDLILIDAMEVEEIPIQQESITKGDMKVYSISCASIVAKVFRDRVVIGLENDYKEHQFSSHKGYGTKAHFDTIKKHGLTPEHRKSFLKNHI